uniref:Uncharacterized protein n=1 Tax=Arundo donax TaxID=35708 RepID=A0A0A9EXX1_ARUDO
MWQVFGHVTRP